MANFLASIAKILGGGKFRKAMRDIEKMTEDDPTIQADLDNLKKSHDDVQASIANFCKRNPDHDLCTGKGPGKSRITKIHW